MPCLNFMPRMVDPILRGNKVHTVRFGKRGFKAGQTLYMQSGPRFKPTRFQTFPCLRVRDIYLCDFGVSIWDENNSGFTVPQRDVFARCDGFRGWEDMMLWLDLSSGEEMRGQLVQWAPATWES